MTKRFSSALVLIIVLAATLPAVILSAPLINRIYQVTSKFAEDELNLIANNTASTISHELALSITRLQALANNRDVILAAQSALFSFQAGSYMAEFSELSPLVEGIYLVDKTPFVIESIPQSIEGLDPTPVLEQVMFLLNQPNSIVRAGYTIVEFNDESYLNTLFELVSRGQGQPAPPRDISSPYGIGIIMPLQDVESRGSNRLETKGLLIAIVPHEKIAMWAKKQIKNSKTSLDLVINHKSMLSGAVSQTPSEQSFFKDSPVLIKASSQNHQFNFNVRVSEPQTERFASANDTLKRLILGVTGTFLMLLIVAIIASRWLTRPLSKLTQTLSQYSAGDYSAPSQDIHFLEFKEVVGVLSEMGTKITNQFNELRDTNDKLLKAQDRLEENNVYLEEQVKQRTQELKNTLTQLETQHNELKEIQVQLVQTEKMSSLGTLVAGVAHEINNPANFAHVGAENLDVELKEFNDTLRHLAGDDAPSEVVELFDTKFDQLFKQADIVLEGIGRIKTIVTDLHTFSRPDDTAQKQISLVQALMSTLNLVRGTFAKNVEFVCQFEAHPEIYCWPAQLNQVFMNLLVNGCQAIKSRQQKSGDFRRGKFVIQTRIIGDDVSIDFADSGTGIPEKIKNQIFEPFFTTKPIGQGTGLGLSISFSIIQKHEGDITVESTEGEGTKFNVRLPISGIKSNKQESNQTDNLEHEQA